MNKISENTAILIFIRTEEQEACAKTFQSKIGKKGNQKIVGKLNLNIIRKARKTGLPVFIHCGEKQIGNTFGERLANGFENIFEKGFEKVIAVGNDCLEVDSKLLLKSSFQLIENESVIGACTDGGAYLIGLSKRAFRKEKFQNLKWETDALFEDLKRYLSEFEICFLPKASDIDSEADFKKVIQNLHPLHFWKKYIEGLFIKIENFHPVFYIIKPTNFSLINVPLRAPPFQISI